MHSIKYILFFFGTLLLVQCAEDDLVVDPYTECCGNNPVEFTVGNSKVYMPSAFTPNNDGINDVFYPFFNEYVQEIKSFFIFSEDGGLIYVTLEMDIQNPAENGWDGIGADGKKHAGAFTYSFEYTNEEGLTRGFSGSACSILCDSFAVTINSKTDCFFPSQHDGKGGLDASLPVLEDCF